MFDSINNNPEISRVLAFPKCGLSLCASNITRDMKNFVKMLTAWVLFNKLKSEQNS